MPRDGSGNFSVINVFTPATVISSSQVNANFSDSGDEITGSLPRDGRAGMSGQLKAADGDVNAPGISFVGDTNTGFRRSASGTVKYVADGADVATFSASGIQIGSEGPLANPTTTRGDLIARGASALDRLAIGSANTILGTDGTDPIWRTVSASIDAAIGSTQGMVLYRSGSVWSALSAGTAGQVLKTGGAGANPSWAYAASVAIYENQQTSGTTGPSYTSGAWRTVTLNTEVVDADNIGSLSSNRVTLGAGTYKAVWSVAFLRGSNSSAVRTRLYNVTDTAVLGQSVNGTGLGTGVGGDENAKTGVAYFTLAGSKALEVQLYCTVNSGTTAAVSTGGAEVYAQLLIEKVL